MTVRGDRGGKVEIEFLGDIARKFEMLLLVLANWDMGRAIGKNIGGHQARIGIKPNRGVLAVFSRFLLELRHAIEPAEARDAIEHPGELGMSPNLALVKHDMFFKIDAAGDEGRRNLPDAGLQFVRLLRKRDRVKIDHAIDAGVGFFVTRPIWRSRRENFQDANSPSAARRKKPVQRTLPCQRRS